MTKQIRFLAMLAMLIFTAVMVNAQGLTTAAINGKVLDSKGEGLPGATVIALHTTSGTSYGTTTRADGGFDLPAMRIGGPYKLTISFVGFKDYVEENIKLALGENRDFNITLQEESVSINELVVYGITDKTFNSGRTGAETNVTMDQLTKIPSISRSITDMTRLTPQSSGSSFAGRSNLYNNLSIDGSVFNNSFGLASSPGGQTNAQPISLDAIQEIQVSLAPYDVRQSGFTGAGINAITRSGTNDIEGSVYTFWRNQNNVGTKVGSTKVTNNNFTQKQMGFRIGGPIINNKLFFFMNAEIERRDDPAHTFLAGRPDLTGANVSNVQAADLDALKDFLITKYNYNPGVYENYKANTYNDKFLMRLDYNLSKNHKLSLRYNYLKSWRDVTTNALSNSAGSRAASLACLPFSDGGYKINNNLNSIVGELNSVFGNFASNNFIIGWTGMRDFRSSNSIPFPMVDILSAGATWTSFGYEQFTANNTLNTDVFQISDNFTIYKGPHTITAGASFEAFKFKNGFMPQYYGYYRFNSLADFYNSANQTATPTIPIYQLQYSAIAGDSKPYAKLSAAQLGIYLQDEWKAAKGLKVTFGLRVDMPFYPSSLDVNPALDPLIFKDPDGNDEKIDVSKLPKATPLFSPRVGFNYDIFGNRKTQLRGGVGVFTGRIPFVWLSNQASNNGMLWGKIDNRGLTINQFNPDVTAYLPATITALSSYEINATVQNFKFPQVLRANFAVDQKLPYGIVATFEGIFSKEINGVYHRNANLPIAAATVNDPSGRNLYPSTGNKINPTITAAYVMDNSNKGYSYFLTAQFAKKFETGLDLMASYTYSKTLDLTSNLNATASSGFGQNHIASNPNQLVLGNSSYDQPHKLVGSINYKVNYLKNLSSGISLVYVGSQGGRFDYYYLNNGTLDMNRDGWANDLIYVPNDESEIILVPQANSGTLVDTRTPAEIWEQLNAYIEQDDYLRSHRGQVVDRNSSIMPWVNQFDLRFTQDVFLKSDKHVNTLEFTLDIINVGNLLNSDWGLRKVITKQQFLQIRSFDASNTPTFSFPYLDFANKVPLTKSFTNDTGLNSRWQIQFGIRYIFE